MKFELSYEETRNLAMILGAAQEAFKEIAKDEATPGILRHLMTQYSERAEQLHGTIVDQVNAQVKS